MDAFANTLDLDQHAEELGYHRFWLAEHHTMRGLAGVAPELLIGVVAQRTQRSVLAQVACCCRITRR